MLKSIIKIASDIFALLLVSLISAAVVAACAGFVIVIFKITEQSFGNFAYALALPFGYLVQAFLPYLHPYNEDKEIPVPNWLWWRE